MVRWFVTGALLGATTLAHADVHIEVPAQVVLGRDPTIEVRVPDLPADASILVTPGTIDGSTWTLPVDRYPQVGLVVVTSAEGDILASKAVPLWGQATLRVETDARASVVVEIEGMYAGPVLADAKGIASVPMIVPPGATEGMTLATTAAGGVKRREVPLGVPPLKRAWTVCTRGGQATLLRWLDPQLERTAAPADTCDLSQAPRIGGKLETNLSTPSLAEVSAPARPRRAPRSVPERVLFSFRAGVTTNLGRVTAPTVAATAGVRLPVLGDRLVADVAFGAYSTGVSAPAMDDSVSGRLSSLRVLGRLAYRVDLDACDVWAGTAMGIAFSRSTLGSEAHGRFDERTAIPAGGVFAGVGRAVAVGQVIVEAAYIHARLDHGPLAGQIGGLQVTAGYSVGL